MLKACTRPPTRPRLDGPQVLPGEQWVAKEPTFVRTLVGSCIAACLWDPVRQVGGMNHFLLPEAKIRPDSESGRYGLFAMELLVNEILAKGGDRRRLVAKVAGGGQILETSARVGDSNIAFIRSFLIRERIELQAEHVGGTRARRVVFGTHTGQMWVQCLGSAETDSVRQEEQRLRPRRPRTGTVELF